MAQITSKLMQVNAFGQDTCDFTSDDGESIDWLIQAQYNDRINDEPGYILIQAESIGAPGMVYGPSNTIEIPRVGGSWKVTGRRINVSVRLVQDEAGDSFRVKISATKLGPHKDDYSSQVVNESTFSNIPDFATHVCCVNNTGQYNIYPRDGGAPIQTLSSSTFSEYIPLHPSASLIKSAIPGNFLFSFRLSK
jgi:hypothetical protein